MFFCGKIRDCLSTLWPSGGVGVACELWRALVVGTADAAVCAAVRCMASQAAARRPSETQKTICALCSRCRRWERAVRGRLCAWCMGGVDSGVG